MLVNLSFGIFKSNTELVFCMSELGLAELVVVVQGVPYGLSHNFPLTVTLVHNMDDGVIILVSSYSELVELGHWLMGMQVTACGVEN